MEVWLEGDSSRCYIGLSDGFIDFMQMKKLPDSLGKDV